MSTSSTGRPFQRSCRTVGRCWACSWAPIRTRCRHRRPAGPIRRARPGTRTSPRVPARACAEPAPPVAARSSRGRWGARYLARGGSRGLSWPVRAAPCAARMSGIRSGPSAPAGRTTGRRGGCPPTMAAARRRVRAAAPCRSLPASRRCRGRGRSPRARPRDDLAAGRRVTHAITLFGVHARHFTGAGGPPNTLRRTTGRGGPRAGRDRVGRAQARGNRSHAQLRARRAAEPPAGSGRVRRRHGDYDASSPSGAQPLRPSARRRRPRGRRRRARGARPGGLRLLGQGRGQREPDRRQAAVRRQMRLRATRSRGPARRGSSARTSTKRSGPASTKASAGTRFAGSSKGRSKSRIRDGAMPKDLASGQELTGHSRIYVSSPLRGPGSDTGLLASAVEAPGSGQAGRREGRQARNRCEPRPGSSRTSPPKPKPRPAR